VRIAAPYYRAVADNTNPAPDFFLHETSDWLVLPYELTGISRVELEVHKPWIVPLLEELKPNWK
jgi:hypothetical protein